MKSYLDSVSFEYYNGKIYEPVPLGSVTLRQFIISQKSPRENIKEVFKQIAKASSEKDVKLKSDLKQNNLFQFTPSVRVENGRSYSAIKSFNDICVLDFDGLEPHIAIEFKKWLFDNLPSCICCYLSPSKAGIKALVRTESVSDIESFKAFVFGLGYYFEKYKGWDGTVQSAVLPLFLSWDEDILFRENPAKWKIRGEKINSFKPYLGEIIEAENISEQDRETVIRIFTKCIADIDDMAHPKNRNFCMMLGGYSSAGYISLEDAEILAEECIRANDYMSKNTNSYLKTGLEFLHKGLSAPLYLKDEE